MQLRFPFCTDIPKLNLDFRLRFGETNLFTDYDWNFRLDLGASKMGDFSCFWILRMQFLTHNCSNGAWKLEFQFYFYELVLCNKFLFGIRGSW
jgi:hypothetical protein